VALVRKPHYFLRLLLESIITKIKKQALWYRYSYDTRGIYSSKNLNAKYRHKPESIGHDETQFTATQDW
jgi:hypothetical protein